MVVHGTASSVAYEDVSDGVLLYVVDESEQIVMHRHIDEAYRAIRQGDI